MPSLLRLPRELRDQILDEVIHSRDPAPIYSWEGPHPPRTSSLDFRYSAELRYGPVEYLQDETTYLPNTLGILLTNRQLHYECMSRLRAARSAFALDVKIRSERELWPTWTCIPTSYQKQISDIYVTIQAVDEPLRSGWIQVGSRPSRLGLAFTALLARFLRLGPVAPRPDDESDGEQQPDGEITIETLHLNVISPDEESGAVGTRASADYIAQSLSGRIRTLTGWYPVRYGDLVYRRIGKVVITTDGVHLKTWDFGRLLRFVPHLEHIFSDVGNMAVSGPGYSSEEELRAWWFEVCEGRRRAGLETPSDETWDKCDEEELWELRRDIRR